MTLEPRERFNPLVDQLDINSQEKKYKKERKRKSNKRRRGNEREKEGRKEGGRKENYVKPYTQVKGKVIDLK